MPVSVLLAEIDFLRGQLAAVDVRRAMLTQELNDALKFRYTPKTGVPDMDDLIGKARVWAERRNYVDQVEPGTRHAKAMVELVAADKELRGAIAALRAGGGA